MADRNQHRTARLIVLDRKKVRRMVDGNQKQTTHIRKSRRTNSGYSE